jgi:hypothetical protein
MHCFAPPNFCLILQWRLRPPAADLLRDHTAAWHELTLMYMLLGAVLLHK